MEEENIEAKLQIENSNQQLEQIIKSAEAVQSMPLVNSANVEYAGFWARFAAAFIDAVILIIPSLIVSYTIGKTAGFFMQYVLMWSYAILMLDSRQATLGKIAVGLKVTTINGEKPTIGKFAIREIIGKSILNTLTLGIGYLMIAFTEKKQGLHDMIANTVVIYDPARKRRDWIALVSIGAIVIVFALIAFKIVNTYCMLGGGKGCFSLD